jgi:hypothetical protein
LQRGESFPPLDLRDHGWPLARLAYRGTRTLPALLALLLALLLLLLLLPRQQDFVD